MLASESVALEGTAHQFERDMAPGRGGVRRPAGQGARAAVRRRAAAHPLHLRVRLPGPSGLGAGRHLGLPGAPEPGRDAGQARGLHRAAQRDRRGHPDPRIQPPQRHAAGAAAGPAVPRRLREEPLRGPHLHHAGAGRAQEVRAPEAQRDRQRVQGPQRAAGGRLHRARHHQPEIVQMARDAGARKVYLASAAPPVRLPQRLRHRHAHLRRAGGARPHRGGDARRSSAAMR